MKQSLEVAIRNIGKHFSKKKNITVKKMLKNVTYIMFSFQSFDS